MRHRLRTAFHLPIGKDQVKGILQLFSGHQGNNGWDSGVLEPNRLNPATPIPPLHRLHEPDAQRAVLVVQEVIGHVLSGFLQKLGRKDVAGI